MAEYHCNYDFYRDGKLLEQTRGAACFASLYYTRAAQQANQLRAYFWTEEGEEIRKNANWFKTHFIMRRLHPRVIGTFEVSPIPIFVEKGVEFDKPGEDHHPLEDKPIWGPWWIGVNFDLTKINGFDLFVMLNLFRYPQESPGFVAQMRTVKKERKCSLDEAFVCAHSVIGNYGHSLQSAKVRYDLEKRWKKYSFLKQWLDVPKDTAGTLRPYSQERRKSSNVSGFFTSYPDEVTDEEKQRRDEDY